MKDHVGLGRLGFLLVSKPEAVVLENMAFGPFLNIHKENIGFSSSFYSKLSHAAKQRLTQWIRKQLNKSKHSPAQLLLYVTLLYLLFLFSR